jgi:hypothetical protein
VVPYVSLPKLEEFIPKEYFPDILLVNDPDRTTEGRRSNRYQPRAAHSKAVPLRYKRLWPKFDRDSDSTNSPPLVAHLDMASAPLLGEGHHSYVHCAAMRLPDPLTARSPSGEVTVAAKMSFSSDSARELLQNEGSIYNEFPQHLMEHWCGLNLVMPINTPVPVGAVVPKFYGYYTPIDDAGFGKLSPILLLEECGKPIEPRSLSLDARWAVECPLKSGSV